MPQLKLDIINFLELNLRQDTFKPLKEQNIAQASPFKAI